jgi:hypothetical protein
MKRTQEQVENDTDAGPTRSVEKSERVWYVRMGVLQTKAGNPYGPRTSVPIADFLSKRDTMARYSLIIPAFTHNKFIPSGKDDQQSMASLWNVYTHPRYFGVLDLDMDLGVVKEGKAALFSDGSIPMHSYTHAGLVKSDFAGRLRRHGTTFGDMIRLCPPFARLYGAIRAFITALNVPYIAYFSGGGGFRILFESPAAWRTVTWGHNYAMVFFTQELFKLLRIVAPKVDETVLAVFREAMDKNIYDIDKGTKPDFLAHFDTHIFPHPLDDAFETASANTHTAHGGLCEKIRAFWMRIFAAIPTDAPPLKIESVAVEPLLSARKHCLHKYYKCGNDKSEATHAVLQGKGGASSYHRVDNIDDLHANIIAYKVMGLLINAHEIRTEITNHVIDYDGGPPLLEPLKRADTGDMETPLQAIQTIQHTLVLEPGQYMVGIYLSSPPRPNEPGTRGHLHWPYWSGYLSHESKIVIILQQELEKRWPKSLHGWDWTKVIESPARLRMLFSDTIDKDTGHVALRPMAFHSCFDAHGGPLDILTMLGWTREDADVLHSNKLPLKLLQLTTLRLDKTEDSINRIAKLLPSLMKIESKKKGTSAQFATLEEFHRKNIDQLLERILADIRVKHGKPDADFYNFEALKLNTSDNRWRSISIGILNHHQCGTTTSHDGNNVNLVVSLDKDHWKLLCFRDGCSQGTRAEYPWGYGRVDTSVLRAAWPMEKMQEAISDDDENENIPSSSSSEVVPKNGETHPDAMDYEGPDDFTIDVPPQEKDKKTKNPIPYMSLAAQAAAQSLLQVATQWAQESGSTSIYLKRAEIQKQCDLMRYALDLRHPDDKQVPAWNMLLSALKYQSLVPCQVMWAKWDTERALINVALLIHEVADKEGLLLEKVPPLEREGKIHFIDVDPYAVANGKDVELVAAEIVERGGPASVTIVTLSPYYSKIRTLAIYAALRKLMPSLEEEGNLPKYETLEAMNVAKDQYVIVDQAHFLGTNEHLLWFKPLSRYRGVTLMGCVYIQTPVQPGMTLNYLFPQSKRATQGESGLRMAVCILLTERPGTWLCESNFTNSATVSNAINMVLKPRATTECVVFLDRNGRKHKHFQTLQLQYKERMLTCSPGHWALQCATMAKHPEYTYRVVMSQQTLERLTLHEWMLLLIVRPQGFREDNQLTCHVVGEAFTKELDVYFLKHIRGKIVYHPRKLAGVRPGQFFLQ